MAYCRRARAAGSCNPGGPLQRRSTRPLTRARRSARSHSAVTAQLGIVQLVYARVRGPQMVPTLLRVPGVTPAWASAVACPPLDFPPRPHPLEDRHRAARELRRSHAARMRLPPPPPLPATSAPGPTQRARTRGGVTLSHMWGHARGDAGLTQALARPFRLCHADSLVHAAPLVHAARRERAT